MTDIWHGRCHIRALTPERRRWIGDQEEAVGRFLMRAQGQADFEVRLTQALHGLGYELVSATQICLAAELAAKDPGGQLARRMSMANGTRPIPVDGFEPAPAGLAWQECDWDELLAMPQPLWAVVDGVSWPEISTLLGRMGGDHACLYSTLDPQSRALAPWLVQVTPGSQIAKLLRARAQETHSFILLQSDLPIEALRRHLRHFTMLKTPADPVAPVYFRFYDPRVLIDALECVRADFRDRFLAPLGGVIAPLSPFVLAPESLKLTGRTIDPLGDCAECQGRLLRLPIAATAPSAACDLRIYDAEFAAIGARMKQRATLKLARRLYLAHGDAVGAERCLRVAASAPEEAAEYGLKTVKQVSAYARAKLLIGDDFARSQPEARGILNDRTLLPWQRKDRLLAWLSSALLKRPDNYTGRMTG